MQSCAYSCLALRLWRSSCMQRTVIAPAVANTLLRVCRVSHAWQCPRLALPGGSPAVLRPTPATAHTVRHRCRSSSTPPVTTCMHMHMCPSQVTRQALCVYEHFPVAHDAKLRPTKRSRARLGLHPPFDSGLIAPGQPPAAHGVRRHGSCGASNDLHSARPHACMASPCKACAARANEPVGAPRSWPVAFVLPPSPRAADSI